MLPTNLEVKLRGNITWQSERCYPATPVLIVPLDLTKTGERERVVVKVSTGVNPWLCCLILPLTGCVPLGKALNLLALQLQL